MCGIAQSRINARRFSVMLPTILCFIVAASIASAQTSPSLRLGVFGAYGGAQTDQLLSIEDAWSPQFSDLSGSYWNSGVVVQFPFTTGNGVNIGLLVQGGYHSATLAQNIPGPELLSLNPDGSFALATTEFQSEISDKSMLLDLAIDLELAGMIFNAGVSTGYRVDVRGQERFAITGPPGIVFDPDLGGSKLIDSVTAEFSSWDEETVDAFVIGPYASLGYRFVSDNLSIDLAAETRLLWTVAIPDATKPLWTYGGTMRVMYAL